MAMIAMEAEWGVFMFFSDFKDQKDREKDSRRKTERSGAEDQAVFELHVRAQGVFSVPSYDQISILDFAFQS